MNQYILYFAILFGVEISLDYFPSFEPIHSGIQPSRFFPFLVRTRILGGGFWDNPHVLCVCVGGGGGETVRKMIHPFLVTLISHTLFQLL